MLKNLKKNLDSLILWLGSICFFFLIVFVSYQVFARYIFGKPSVMLEESSRILQIWLALFGASYCWGNKKHIAITFFLSNFPRVIKIACLVFIEIACFGIIIFVFISGGIDIVSQNFGQLTSALGIPKAYIYMILPFSGILMFIYSIFNFLDIVETYKTL